MKRRVLSFMIALTLCLNLCPVWAFAAGEGTDDSVSADNSEQIQAQPNEIYASYDGLAANEQQQVDLPPCDSLQDQLDGMGSEAPGDNFGGSVSSDHFYTLTGDSGQPTPFEVSSLLDFNTSGYTYTGTGSAAIRVSGTGRLYLTGTVSAPNGIGVEVLSNGFLSITEPNTSITGDTYALDIASGAQVRLSTGRYSGRAAAIQIRTADDDFDFADLLEPGYAYFDGNDNLLLPADAAWARILVVGRCSDPVDKITYTHTPGATGHTWACPYCVTEETEACTFTFDQNGRGNCASCGNTITIAVDESGLTGLVYDGTVKAEDVSITVTLADGSNKELVKDADYTVDYTPRADAGEITVAVTGITFNGTFTKTYTVEQDQPRISWDAATCAVNYGGSPVDSTKLPDVIITISSTNGEDLHPYLQYFYRRTGEEEFTDGLPTNAGTYEVKAYLPESQNYKEAETNLLTLTINKIPAVATAPAAKTLTYNREAQELVTAGVLKPGAAAEGAVIEFARAKGGPYSTDIPTEITAGNHTVWYRAAETENYAGTLAEQVSGVRIELKTLTPTVELSYYTTVYDGGVKEPKVTVKDGEYEIPINEYTATYSNNQNAGTAKVTVTNKTNGNYTIKNPGVTVEFKITAQPQAALSIANQPSTVIYGDTFTLGTQGGSGNGAVTWKITAGNDVATVVASSGQVTVTGVGSVTVQATKSGTDPATNKTNYNGATASWTFNIGKKPVTPTVTADDKPYDGKTDATLHAAWKTGDMVGADNIALNVTGEFATADAGANKRVNIETCTATGNAANKYTITWPDSTTASIYKVDAQIENPPQPNLGSDSKGLVYNKAPQPLVTGGTTVGNIGTIVYSTSQNGAYSTNIPTGTEARTYTVWYKVADSVNYTGIPAAEIEVEIAKADPKITNNSLTPDMEGQPLSEISLEGVVSADIEGTFAWENDSATVESGKFYNVIFTPKDTAYYNTVIVQVQVTIPEPPEPEPDPGPEPEQPEPGSNTNSTSSIRPGISGTSSTPAGRPGTSGAVTNTLSTPIQTAQTVTTVRNGTASTVVSAAEGSKLVQQAVENRNRNVVIKPEITGDVAKAEVSIPSSTVSRLGSETDAALTVSSPVADVTIPNAALGTLSQAGGTVSVVTEQVEQSVVLTLAAGGETVEQVPGGVTLAVPVEDAGPGTVAVLVHDDGTRETIRKSVAGDGVMNIPLSGSATVEIVDNSKDFDDVPPESWAADAVDFASSHELFSGTSETTFSPDAAMSRGMLATVLYRLEGSPDQELTDLFSDVNSGAWYEEGVAWAVENGVAGGYGDGQFGPDDNITREQFVVMLWRYAGSPQAGSQVLNFVDADQVSSFALEALCWAAENGILHGVGDGVLDPGGMATRAQAAQLLKNFMERT